MTAAESTAARESDAAIQVDVGGSETLVRVDLEEIALLAAVPHGADAETVDAAVEDLQTEIKYTRRVNGGGRS